MVTSSGTAVTRLDARASTSGSATSPEARRASRANASRSSETVCGTTTGGGCADGVATLPWLICCSTLRRAEFSTTTSAAMFACTRMKVSTTRGSYMLPLRARRISKACSVVSAER